MARIFLSYTRVDREAVRRLREALRVAGHEPWDHEEEVLVGESIPRAVDSGLRNADFVVLCLSNAAAARGWIEAERDATLMRQYAERRERILPARLDDVALPVLLASLKYVDLFPDDHAFEQGVTRLIHSIGEYEARHARSKPSPANLPHPT